MRMLSLWQPTASLVAKRIKTSETRSWPPPLSMIGEVFGVHATMRLPKTGLSADGPHADEIAFVKRAARLLELPGGIFGIKSLPYGAVLATARLVDAFCVTTWVRVDNDGKEQYWPAGIGIAPGYTLRCVEPDGLGDYSFGRWVWLLEDIEPLPEPIPARGRQRIWHWTPPAAGAVCGDDAAQEATAVLCDDATPVVGCDEATGRLDRTGVGRLWSLDYGPAAGGTDG